METGEENSNMRPYTLLIIPQYNKERFFCFFRVRIICIMTICLFIIQYTTTVYCSQITMQWKGNSETDIAGYRVHYGKTSRFGPGVSFDNFTYDRVADVGNNTSLTIPTTEYQSGTHLYITATAYDFAGNESIYADELVHVVSINSSDNQPPNANDDVASLANGTSLNMDLISNDFDTDGSIDPTTLVIVNIPTNGNVVNHLDGTVTYTPNTEFSGTDSFTYTVHDTFGDKSNLATVVVDVYSGVISDSLRIQPPDKDTFIRDGVSSDNNFGSQDRIQLKCAIDGYQRWGILGFDISNLDKSATITSAYLDLFYYNNTIGIDPVGEIVEVNRVTQKDWVEKEVTWDNYKNITAWSREGGDYTTADQATLAMPADFGWVRWTVTEQAKHAQKTGSGTMQMLIKFASNSTPNVAARFYSNDYVVDPSKWPRLIVNYTTTGNIPPTLSLSDPDGAGDTVLAGEVYNITYDLADSDDVVTAAFYYDIDNTGFDGIEIGACASLIEGEELICSWDTTGIPPGGYYVYGRTDDGVNPPIQAYSPGRISINTLGKSSVMVQTSSVDAYIRDGTSSNTNYGAKTSVQIKTAMISFQRRAIFRFDFSGLDDRAEISSAYLEMYYSNNVIGNDPVGETIEVNRVTKKDWVEEEVTWDVYKNSTAWFMRGGDYTTVDQATAIMPDGFGWVRWAVTDLVKYAQSNSAEVLDVLVKFAPTSTPNSAARFCSSNFEDSSKRPKLTIHYTTQ